MKIFAVSLLALTLAAPVLAQQSYDPHAIQAKQKAELGKLAFMDGVWRGTAYNIGMDGVRHDIVQTERIGPMLGGALKVIEGRGYNADGSLGFNAFAVISFDANKNAYNMRSYAMGNEGDFEFTPTATGYVWKIPAGPMTIRYTATVKDSTFNEVGDRIMPDGKSIRFFEMNLKRVSDTTWPSGQAVPMK
jgi:hypothetical protein